VQQPGNPRLEVGDFRKTCHIDQDYHKSHVISIQTDHRAIQIIGPFRRPPIQSFLPFVRRIHKSKADDRGVLDLWQVVSDR
jgi:hypothetical protein